MSEIFTTKSGVDLRLKPVNTAVLDGIVSRMFSAIASDPGRLAKMQEMASAGDVGDDKVLSLFGEDIGAIAAVGEKLFIYCAGWGVENDPPKDNELLNILGASEKRPHERRAYWVRTILADQEEVNTLIKTVQRISRAKKET